MSMYGHRCVMVSMNCNLLITRKPRKPYAILQLPNYFKCRSNSETAFSTAFTKTAPPPRNDAPSWRIKSMEMLQIVVVVLSLSRLLSSCLLIVPIKENCLWSFFSPDMQFLLTIPISPYLSPFPPFPYPAKCLSRYCCCCCCC